MNYSPVGGSSLLKQLEKVEKESGKTPPKLKEFREAETPECFKYLLELFTDFYNGGTFSYTELQSYIAAMGLDLKPYECEILRQLWLEKEATDYQRRVKLEGLDQPKRKRKRGR